MEVEIGLTVEQWNVISELVFEFLIGVFLMTTIIEISAFYASRHLANGHHVRPHCTIASRVFAVDTLYLPASLGWRGLACVLALGAIIQGFHILAEAGVGARVKYGDGSTVLVYLPDAKGDPFENPVASVKNSRSMYTRCGTNQGSTRTVYPMSASDTCMTTGAAVLKEACSGLTQFTWGDGDTFCSDEFESQVGLDPFDDVVQIQVEGFLDFEGSEVRPESPLFEPLNVEVVGRTTSEGRFAVCRLHWDNRVRMCFIQYSDFTLLLTDMASVAKIELLGLYDAFNGSLEFLSVGLGINSFKAIIPSKVLLQQDSAPLRRLFHELMPAGEVYTGGTFTDSDMVSSTLSGWLMAERGVGLEFTEVEDTSEGTARSVTVLNLARLLPLCVLSMIAAVVKVVVWIAGRNRAWWLPTDIEGVYKQVRCFSTGGSDFRMTPMPDYNFRHVAGEDANVQLDNDNVQHANGRLFAS